MEMSRTSQSSPLLRRLKLSRRLIRHPLLCTLKWMLRPSSLFPSLRAVSLLLKKESRTLLLRLKEAVGNRGDKSYGSLRSRSE